MKRKMKVIVLMLLMTFLTSGFALGAEEGKADGEVLMLSLEEALAMARENNQQVKLAKLGLEKAELAREQFRFQDKKRDNLINNPPRKPSEEEALIDPEKYEKDLQDYITWEMTAGAMNEFSVEQQFELLDKQTEIGIDLAKRGIDAAVRSIDFGVEGSYYGAIFARESLAIAEAALERQEDMLRVAEAKFRAGTAAKQEVMDAQVQVARARAEVVKAQSEKEKAYMNLKELLGLNLDQKIELDFAFVYEPLEEIPALEELLEEALEHRIDIAQAKAQLEIAQLDFDYTKKAYPSITFVYKQKEHALLEARLNLEDAKTKVEKEIRGLLLDILDAQTNIPVLEESVALAQESLRLAKLSYEAGLLRRVDVDTAEEGLRQVELQHAMAISNYNLAKLKLENVPYISTAVGGI